LWTSFFQASHDGSDSVIFYKLVSGNGAGLFHVEPYTGHVRVAASLADKDGSKFTLEVSASEGGQEPSTYATVDVSVFCKHSTRLVRACLQGERVTLALTHFLFFSSSCLQGSEGYPGKRVTLAGGLTFSLANTPGRVNPPTRVNFLIVFTPFECNRALSCPGL